MQKNKEFMKALEDELSRKVYQSRVEYSETGNVGVLEDMISFSIRRRSEWVDLLEMLSEVSTNNKLFLYGAGIWGNILYQETKTRVKWDAIIDKYPQNSRIQRKDVFSLRWLKSVYAGEYIVVSSYKNMASIVKDLTLIGIPEEKIINAGKAIFALTEQSIYFDLEPKYYQGLTGIFIDGGCFDGLNAKTYLEMTKDISKAICFEPDRRNISKIQDNLKNNNNRYSIVDKALWSEEGVLGILEQGNVASSVFKLETNRVSDDITMVKATTIDATVQEQVVSMIKLDIEGAELEALKGAKQTIIRDKPLLAISIYHKKEDIYTIPEYIMELDLGYHFYLRHYSFSDYDTVLYAVQEV